jgi:ubiquinone biosynthesis monooxygenase Coq6
MRDVLVCFPFRQMNGSFFCSRISQSGRRGRHYATASNIKAQIYDIVCIGGGPAGLSLLAALRKFIKQTQTENSVTKTPLAGSSPITSHLKIALVDTQNLNSIRSFSLPSTQFSNRCSSLTPSSIRFLDSIGVWNHVDKSRVQAYESMHVWDGITGASIEFDKPVEKEQCRTIAYMNENLNLTSALLKRIDELGGLDVFDGQRVENIGLGEASGDDDLRSWPVVHLQEGGVLTARLLVGADGANSPVRAFAGIESRGWDYNRQGLVATLELEGFAGPKAAYQRFLPTGPVAMLPLPGNYSTLVWSTTPALAEHLKSLSAIDFTAMVNAAFKLSAVDLEYMHSLPNGQVDEISWRSQHTRIDPARLPQQVVGLQEGSRASFPLKLRHADAYIGERVALVGDAAHTVHPLAGQGLNLGQGDVECLAKTIQYAISHGQDIGATMSLEAYNEERYAVNNLLLGVVDKLHKLYTVESGPLVALRSIGLKTVNALGPAKQFLMSRAAGTGVKIL